MRFRVLRDAIEFASGQRAQFSAPVLHTLDLGDLLIVILDPGPSGQFPENVYAIDGEGRVVWRVQEYEFPHGRTPYTGAYVAPAGLALYNRSGVEAIVDPSNGRIVSTDLVR
jgi:hypothetical protein